MCIGFTTISLTNPQYIQAELLTPSYPTLCPTFYPCTNTEPHHTVYPCAQLKYIYYMKHTLISLQRLQS